MPEIVEAGTIKLDTPKIVEANSIRLDSPVTSWRQGEPSSSMFDFFGPDAAKEKAKAANAFAMSEMLNIAPGTAYEYHDEISAQLKDKLDSEKIITEKKGMGQAVKAGWDTSLAGMMMNEKAPGPFESVSQAENFVKNMVALGVDLPFFALGYAIGGGTPVSGSAGAFGFTSGLRQVLMDRYEKGEARTPGEFFERVRKAAIETVKGQIVGGFTGGVGYMAPVWMQKLAPGVAPNVGWKTSLELATLTAAGRMIEGQLPTAKDLLDNAVLIGVLHASARGVEVAKARIPEIRGKLQEAYTETGIHPREIREILANEPVNPKEDVTAKIDRVVEELKATLPPEKQAEGAGKVAEKPAEEISKPEKVETPAEEKVVPGATLEAGRSISDDALDYIDTARRNHVVEMANEFKRNGAVKVQEGHLTYIVHKSTKEPGKIQVTVADERGPTMDFQAENLRDALAQLTEEYLPVKRYGRPDLPDTALMDVFPEGGEYIYSYRSRPMSLGTQPKGFIRAEEGGKWGKVVYDRPLTAEEIKKFELVPEKFIEKNSPPAGEGAPEKISIKKADVDAAREAAGLPKVETGKRTIEEMEAEAKEAVDSGKVDPRELARKINNIVDIGERPREYNNDLVNNALKYDMKNILNEQEFLDNKIKVETDPKLRAEMQARYDALAEAADMNQRATDALAPEWGLAGVARKTELENDYRYPALIIRLRKEGIEITPEIQEEMRSIANNLADVQSRIVPEAETRIAENLEKTVKQLRNEEGLRQRREKREVKREDLDAELESLAQKFHKEYGATLSANAMFEPGRYKILIDMTRNRIQKGIVEAAEIVDSIHVALTNAGIEISKRDLRDAISQYGVTREMSKDEINVKKREAVRQMQLISALEDAEKGLLPLKSGLQRDKQTQKVRELTKKVKLAMRESGIDFKDERTPEEQWQSSLDSVKTRLKNTIYDLAKRLEEGKKREKKEGIRLDEEALALMRTRDKVLEVVEFAEGPKDKPEISPEQKIRMAERYLEKSIAEYERRITENDINTQRKRGKTLTSPQLTALRMERDLVKELYETLKEESKPKKTPEERRHEAFVRMKTDEIAEYERRIAEEDYTEVKKSEKLTLTDRELKLKFEADKLKKEFNLKKNEYLRKQRDMWQVAKDSVVEMANVVRAVKSSIDVSAPGRQGFFAFMSHPIAGFRNIPEMFRAMKSEEAAFKAELDINNRENYKNGMYDQADIMETRGGEGTKVNELYRSRWAKAIPGVSASERAFVTFLNSMRADLFDAMHKYAFPEGKATKAEIRALGEYVNQATGRGTLRGHEHALNALGTFLWAPKLVLSRFQMLAGHGLLPGGGRTAATRKAVLREYVRILSSLALIYAVNDVIELGDVETDTTSSDYRKIKVGNTRIDILAGVSQATVFLSRVIWGETKSTTTGEVSPLRGDNMRFGAQTTGDVIWRFLRSKLTPVLGMTVNQLEGKDMVGNPVTLYDIPEEALVPLAVGDIYDAMQEEGVPAGLALGTLGMFGIGIQTHEQKGARR